MAQLGQPGHFFRGKHQKVRVTKVGPDEETPLEVREALVGMILPIIFTQERLAKQDVDLGIPKGSALSYGSDVIAALKEAGKESAAELLFPQLTSEFDMYVFEPEIFEFVEG
jgi:hypothetical protein